jgi:hypothetical protein
MPDGASPTIDVAELERAVRAVEPGARLVPPRVLRRAIRHDRKLAPIGPRVPHRKSYVLHGDVAGRVVEPDELGLGPGENPPRDLVLLARPDPEGLQARPRGEVLRDYWRLLFHARVHQELDRRAAVGALDRAGVRARIDRIGQVEFDEVRVVLRQEDYLLPPYDDRSTYVEFAAVYLELRSFADTLIPVYFPGIRDFDRIDALLAEDVDADAALAGTRLAGAPDPATAGPCLDEEPEEPPEPEEPEPTDRQPRSEAAARGLLQRADDAVARGNDVRAAILRAVAARRAPAGMIGRARAAARRDLDRLATRLGAALGLDDHDVQLWRRALPPLLERARRGFWTAEARLLYDLQKVCLDRERTIYKVDLVEWALSLGRKPINRPLPAQDEVLVSRYLRVAARKLSRSRLTDRDRGRLAPLLRDALDRVQADLRRQFRPRIARALEHAGMTPRNLPERVAARKLTEELLDKIAGRGFLAIGDLRDAVSGNNLKLPDLAGPAEFFRGDRLLRADRALADELDGVYRPGEFYLRWLQRFSALAFGTPLGRFLTKYVALPYGGAFVLLKGLHHMAEMVARPLHLRPVAFDHPIGVAAVGTATLVLLHSAKARGWAWRVLRVLFRALRVLLYDAPAWVLDRPVVRAVIESWAFGVVARSLLLPAGIAAASWVLMPRDLRDGRGGMVGAAGVYLSVSLLLNSRLGRDLGESAADALDLGWRRFRVSILPGLYRFVMDVFDRLLEAVDRMLYTVDEWLRFRGDQGQAALLGKAVTGVVWFYVAYVVRFCVNLLIEPQVNPIKHFPVVTVAHKVTAPVILGSVPHALMGPPWRLGREAALATAGTMQMLLPGVFGFLVWELKENWKLYEANRPRSLQPVAIGHHGETMVRLMRPGFHSGTIPKGFARLRRAHQKADGRAARRQRDALRHAAEAVGRFVDRDLLMLLHESPSLGPLHVAVGEIQLGCNRVRVELRSPSRPGEGLWVSFDEQSGRLLAGLADEGLLARLAPDGRRTLEIALAGLYKMAGVDLVREQVRAALGPEAPPYDVAPEGLVVWPNRDYGAEAFYDLDDGPVLVPRPTSAPEPLVLPTLDRGSLLFRDAPVPWTRWVDAWERDLAGRGHPDPFLPDFVLLPPADEARAPHAPSRSRVP